MAELIPIITVDDTSDSDDIIVEKGPNDIIIEEDPNDIIIEEDPNDIIIEEDPNDIIEIPIYRSVNITGIPSVKSTTKPTVNSTVSVGEGSSNMHMQTSTPENVPSQLIDIKNYFSCTICLEVFIKPITLSCSHTFCNHCYTRWEKSHDCCPICREKVIGSAVSLALEIYLNEVIPRLSVELSEKRQSLERERGEDPTGRKNKMEAREARKRKRQERTFINAQRQMNQSMLLPYSDDSEDSILINRLAAYLERDDREEMSEEGTEETEVEEEIEEIEIEYEEELVETEEEPEERQDDIPNHESDNDVSNSSCPSHQEFSNTRNRP